jgi:hypothetical protein
VADSCEYGDARSGSGVTELVQEQQIYLFLTSHVYLTL